MLRITLITCFALSSTAAIAGDSPGAHFIENWDFDRNDEVSLEEVSERRETIFTMFDTDENGSLDAAEYQMFDETREADMEMNAEAHSQGKGGQRMQRGMTLEFNDTNEDGVVDKDEFTSHSAEWFAILDKNEDGVVTSSDFGPKGLTQICAGFLPAQ